MGYRCLDGRKTFLNGKYKCGRCTGQSARSPGEDARTWVSKADVLLRGFDAAITSLKASQKYMH